MKRIVLYYVPNAPASEQAKEYLEGKGVKFSLVDVSNPANARKLAKQTHQWTAPVLASGDEAILGFDEAMYDEFLKRER